jgi:cell division septation protein DedD
MGKRMRDQQLLQEDPEARGRRLGTLVMGALMIVALVLSVGLALGRAASSASRDRIDPLEELARIRVATPTIADESARRVAPERAPTAPIDATKLTFQRELTEEEDRPEVAAVLEAAAREAERRAPKKLPLPTEELTLAPPRLPSERESRPPSARTAMPAGMSASSANGKLTKAARHDKLVAAAMPQPNPHSRAHAGSDGEYTLQVMSFDTAASADAFATTLRDKGHEAFVLTGEENGRARSYRVRIGPFPSKSQADAYRRGFDARENMNTIVIKRQEQDRGRD